LKLGIAGCVVVLATLPAFVRAQDPPEAPGPGGARGEAARMVDAYVLSNLQESLGLSDDQFTKLLPLVKRLQTDRRDAMQRRRRAMVEMRRLLKSGVATEPQVIEKLKELKAVEAEERGRDAMDAIDAQLTPLQQAKFRVFESEVGQKLREMMSQLRRQNRPGSRPDGGRPRGSPEP
jgi:Spy/CpxP family protein refolding chaperone